MTVVFHIIIKYLLHTHDLQQHHPWENKAVYMLYAELFISKLITYPITIIYHSVFFRFSSLYSLYLLFRNNDENSHLPTFCCTTMLFDRSILPKSSQ